MKTASFVLFVLLMIPVTPSPAGAAEVSVPPDDAPALSPQVALGQAVSADDAAGVRAALAAGAEPDRPVPTGKGGASNALTLAICGGKLAAAQALVDAGAVVPESDVPQVSRMIYQGFLYRMPKAATFALEHGGDARYVFPDGKTLLHHTVSRGITQMTQRLIEAGCEVDALDREGESAFSLAVTFGKFKDVDLLLEAGADPLKGGELREVLYDLLRAGREDLFLRLVALPGAELTPDDATRLLSATLYMTRVAPKAAEVLLEAGARPELRDQSSAMARSVDLLSMEKVRGGETRYLYDLLRERGEAEAARAFLTRAAAPNALDDAGMNPLLRAAKAGEAGRVRELLTGGGVWLEVPDAREGRSALLWAVAQGHVEVAALLLEAGANREAVDAAGGEVLGLAMARGDLEMAQRLIRYGADPFAEAEGRPSAMDRAQAGGVSEFVRLFEACEAAVGEAEWTQDVEAAFARAKADRQPMLLLFTGSDWCGYCVMLEREVFHSFGFKHQVGGKVGLVMLDYPRRKGGQPEEVVERNAELKARYTAGGFPTVILTDPDGNELSRRVGFAPGTGSDWMKWLRTQLGAALGETLELKNTEKGE